MLWLYPSLIKPYLAPTSHVEDKSLSSSSSLIVSQITIVSHFWRQIVPVFLSCGIGKLYALYNLGATICCMSYVYNSFFMIREYFPTSVLSCSLPLLYHIAVRGRTASPCKNTYPNEASHKRHEQHRSLCGEKEMCLYNCCDHVKLCVYMHVVFCLSF